MAVATPGGRNRKLIGIVAGLVIAALGLGGAILYVNRQSPSAPTSSLATRSVVVTKSDVSPTARLDDSNTTEVQRPATDVPPASFAHVADIVGRFAAIQLAPNEILTTRNTVVSPLATINGVPLPPLEIPDHWVAMAIPDSTAQGVGGYIRAGDHIDFMIQDSQRQVRYFLQDVKVLRLGEAAQQGAAAANASASLLIIALPRDQAEDLSYVLNEKSNGGVAVLRYVLRPRDEYFPETLLKQPVGAADATITVQHNATLYKACGPCGTITVNIGSEQMQVTKVTLGNGGDSTVDMWTVSRGLNSTVATAHNTGDAVFGAAQYISPLNAKLPPGTDNPVGPAQFDQLFKG